MGMDMARIFVDFNTYMRDGIRVLLTLEDDYILDSSGTKIILSEGIIVHLYEPNDEWNGTEYVKGYLYADGVVERYKKDDGVKWKWCCVLDKKGIYYS